MTTSVQASPISSPFRPSSLPPPYLLALSPPGVFSSVGPLPLDPSLSGGKRSSQADAPLPPSKRLKSSLTARRTTLWSYATKSPLGEHAMGKLRHTAAVLHAEKLDREHDLDPSQSEVCLVTELPSSQSEVFEHRNSGQWQIDALRCEGHRAMLANGLRCLYDAFYYKCGYRPKWDPWVRATEPKVHRNSRFKTRGECVQRNRKVLKSHGINKNVLRYLSGDKCRYSENQDAIHEMNIAAVGAAINMLSRKASAKRAQAYLLVWKLVTGHDTYEAAVGDNRLIGTKGIQTVEEGSEDDFEDKEDDEDEDDFDEGENDEEEDIFSI